MQVQEVHMESQLQPYSKHLEPDLQLRLPTLVRWNALRMVRRLLSNEVPASTVSGLVHAIFYCR